MNNADRYIKIDYQMVSRFALQTLIEEFITREGTDYGLVEKGLEEKILEVTPIVSVLSRQVLREVDLEDEPVIELADHGLARS